MPNLVIYSERDLGMGLFLIGSPAIPTNFDVPLHSDTYSMVPCGTYCVRLFDSRLGSGKRIKGGP